MYLTTYQLNVVLFLKSITPLGSVMLLRCDVAALMAATDVTSLRTKLSMPLTKSQRPKECMGVTKIIGQVPQKNSSSILQLFLFFIKNTHRQAIPLIP